MKGGRQGGAVGAGGLDGASLLVLEGLGALPAIEGKAAALADDVRRVAEARGMTLLACSQDREFARRVATQASAHVRGCIKMTRTIDTKYIYPSEVGVLTTASGHDNRLPTYEPADRAVIPQYNFAAAAATHIFTSDCISVEH